MGLTDRIPGKRLLDHWWDLSVDFAYAGGMRVGALVNRVATPPTVGKLAPVVLVPGVFETWHFMKPVAARLATAGHPVHFVAELGRNAAPIPDAAATVARYLEQHDLTSAVLIGHSKGGLIGKHLMLLDDPDGRVDRLIALASPFNGSSYARYLPGRPVRDFKPTAATLSMLAANAEVNARITSIYPVWDGHIPEGSELEGAVNVQVPVIGHFRVLADPRSLDAVAAAVAAAKGVD